MSDLYHLFVELFNGVEFRLWLISWPHGPALLPFLPPNSAPDATLFLEASQTLHRQGLVNDELFESLLKIRPYKSQVIQETFYQMGIKRSDLLTTHTPKNHRIVWSLSELKEIFTRRALQVVAHLAKNQHIPEYADALTDFQELHILHMRFLEQGDLVKAHSILNQIHSLSSGLEQLSCASNETTPFMYNQSIPSQRRGKLIRLYVSSDSFDTNNVYPSQIGFSTTVIPKLWHRELIEFYNLLYKNYKTDLFGEE